MAEMNKVVALLIFQIEKVDCLRVPFKWFPRNFFYTTKKTIIYDFFRNDFQKFALGVDREIDTFFNDYRRKSIEGESSQVLQEIGKNSLLIALLFVASAFLAGILNSIVLAVFRINIGTIFLYVFFFVFFIFSVIGYIIYKGKVEGNLIGGRYDNELKDFAQKLINFTMDFIKKHDIDFKIFELKLRHDDYQRLTFKKKSENLYSAYFKED